MKYQGVVVIGVQWGDEGKGKVVDHYAAQTDCVARFQGGNNAGHTIVVGGKQTILHLIPSGVLQQRPRCFIGSGVVVDPEIFLEEIQTLRHVGLKNLETRILLSDRCHLILDYHKHLDAAREERRSRRLGTTKRGIGPAYEDRAARRGVRVSDLFNHALFEQRVKSNLEEKNFLLQQFYKTSPVSMGDFVNKYASIAASLKPFVCDVATTLHQEIQAGKTVLYEGAQGILLDMDYGTYPYVTSSHTLPSQAALGVGARLPEKTLFIGVIKAYSTRVGEGPFPTELKDDLGNKLRESGMEFGATTGRPRRCGWLDLVAVKYALQISGITNLAMTKADVLSGIDSLKICIGYSVDGKKLETVPADTELFSQAMPIYEELPGWGKITGSEIPRTLQRYIKFIEDYTGAKVNLISTGADRNAVIELERAF